MPESPSAAWPVVSVLATASGLALRVVAPTRLPDGPWLDETCAIRAARTLVASGTWAPFGTSPIYPPEAGIPGAFEPNLYFLLTAFVDRLAGGGMASVRAISVGSSVLLFLAALVLAAELFGRRSRAFAFSAVLLAGSGWMLRLGRWGWMSLLTAALLALALALSLRAVRTRRLPPAALAGLLLGLSQYGYLPARIALVFAFGALALALFRRVRGGVEPSVRVPAAIAGTALLVALPLFVHLARTPERAATRIQALAPSGGTAALAPALLRNGVDQLSLFFGPGDPSPRHAEPGRGLWPLPVGLAALAGVVLALLSGGAARTTALAALAILAANLATKGGDDAVNSFRVLASAAPFLILAAGAFDRLAGEVERKRPARGTATAAASVVAVLVCGVSLLDAFRFVRWGRDPVTDSVLGGPERRLADRLRALGAGRDAEFLVAARAADARMGMVEVLLGAPGGGARGARVELEGLAGPSPRIAFASAASRDLLFVDFDAGPEPDAARLPGVRLVERIPAGDDRPPLRVFRVPAAAAGAAATEAMAPFPKREASPDGDLVVEEDGLCRVDETVNGSPRSRVVRLAPGRHRSGSLLSPGGVLAGFTGPDGYPRRLPL